MTALKDAYTAGFNLNPRSAWHDRDEAGLQAVADAVRAEAIAAINENAGKEIRVDSPYAAGVEVLIHEGVKGWPTERAIAYGSAISESIEAIRALTPSTEGSET